MKNKNESIAFLCSFLPDDVAFKNPAFCYSGFNVLDGIIGGLSEYCEVEIISDQPHPSFPRSKHIFISRKKCIYKEKNSLLLMPYINLLILKELIIGIYTVFSVVIWFFRNINKKKHLLVYNTYSPALPFVYFVSKILGVKLTAILYDVGIPSKELNFGKLRMYIYRFVDWYTKILIPKIDGRIVINEAISLKYAPKRDFLLIDGGISKSVINNLFELVPRLDENNEFIFLCAGSLWYINGIRFILEAMKENKNKNIRIWFAGVGPDTKLILNASQSDSRIIYKGSFNQRELFKLYQEVDVLMNIRIISGEEGNFVFPSKLLEYLVVGKYVISSTVAHAKRDYGDVCNFFNISTPSNFADLLNEVSNIPKSKLFLQGVKSRKFMLERKTWTKQSESIYSYITRCK